MKNAIRCLQLTRVQNQTLIISKERDIAAVNLQHLGRKKEDFTNGKRVGE